MGAEASLTLYHKDKAICSAAIEAILAEMRRLELIFSLYQENSELSILNKTGHLEHPSQDLLSLLEISEDLHQKTDGLFDPTIQPLFELFANYYSVPRIETDTGPSEEDIQHTLQKVGLPYLDYANHYIRFNRPNMALSFNGIAQGYMTDRATDILHARGFQHALINMGEYRAIGGKPSKDGSITPWNVGVADAEAPWELYDTLPLKNQAIATSAPSGAAFNTTGKKHHLLNPKTGTSENHYLSMTVIAPTATLADGLSTAFILMPPHGLEAMVHQFANIGLLARLMNGHEVRLGT